MNSIPGMLSRRYSWSKSCLSRALKNGWSAHGCKSSVLKGYTTYGGKLCQRSVFADAQEDGTCASEDVFRKSFPVRGMAESRARRFQDRHILLSTVHFTKAKKEGAPVVKNR